MSHDGPVAYAEKLGGAPHSKQSLRLWLRLLSCSLVIEKRIKVRLEREFNTTLPRFDVLAVLDRHPNGLTMTQLSQSLMVTNGNATGLVDRLIEDQLVVRQVSSEDRRLVTVTLTPRGRETFARMAKVHEAWVDNLLAGVTDAEIVALLRLLGSLRHSVESSDT